MTPTDAQMMDALRAREQKFDQLCEEAFLEMQIALLIGVSIRVCSELNDFRGTWRWEHVPNLLLCGITEAREFLRSRTLSL